MSYNYQRPRDLSPGGRRVQNPGRVSDNTLNDPYYSQRHNSYVSPRSSGVIPLSTETFINVPPPNSTSTGGNSSRADPRFETYSGRPRRSSLVDTARGSSSTTQLPTRSRPTVIQQDIARPASPSKPVQPAQPSREYYVMPASSQEPRSSGGTHKKLYSVDGSGAKLLADIPAAGERQHKRRDSTERSGYRTSGADRDRTRGAYHSNGTQSRYREKSIEDEDAFSYTDPLGMYTETEPRWRDVRPRRGSMDRAGAVSRERPVSLLDPTSGTRQIAKEVGPPPSTRGWDKINEIGRARTVRDSAREVAQSPTRGRGYQDYGGYVDPRDPYYIPPRTNSTDRRFTGHNYDTYEVDSREPRRPERRHSISRDPKTDRSVERRGFGIRTDVRNESQSRYTGRDGRGSDENFEQSRYRDSGYTEPHRRETAPGSGHQEANRSEQDKRDRGVTQRLQPDDYAGRQRGYSDVREYSREPRRRDEERTYDRDYDRPQERDRSRVDRTGDRERDRHHHRRDTDRDRRDGSPRQSNESGPKSGFAQAALGGLAGVTATKGLTHLLDKVTNKQSKEKDGIPERDSDRERERDRDRDRNERGERKTGEEREQPRERRQGASEDTTYDDRHLDNNPSLGFAYETQEPPPNTRSTNAEWTQERKADRNQSNQNTPNPERGQETEGSRESDAERSWDHKNNDPKASAEMPAPAIDPDEDYRRRLEQVQRELGRGSDEQRATESDADRERRRREREQRQRDRESRNGGGSFVAGDDTASYESQSTYRDDLSSYASTVGTDLKRKPSILDKPMTDEPDQMAQVIDNSMSDRRENRVRIVDPPTEEEERKPKGILKKPTEKFPEDRNAVREGVAPLKDATKKGIPPGARWTKIDRRLVNPEALEAAQERFEERLDCVIVLRVLTKEEIQKLADRTREIRDRRYEEDRTERKTSRRSDRNRDRRDRDEYEFSDSEDEFKQKAPKMLEAPSTTGSSNNADFIRENRERRSDREKGQDPSYMSGGLGRREESQVRY